MPRFRKRPIEVEAARYSPGAATPGVCPGSCPGGANPSVGPHVHTARGRVVPVSPGEWVVKEAAGPGYYPVAADLFAGLFEPAGGGRAPSPRLPRWARLVLSPRPWACLFAACVAAGFALALAPGRGGPPSRGAFGRECACAAAAVVSWAAMCAAARLGKEYPDA